MTLGHGGNIEEIARTYNIKEDEIIDFSANINPVGISNKVREAMIKAIDKVERYPDITYYDLKNEISKFENISFENILVSNGAAEAIFNISRGLKPKKALIMAPTFCEYEDSLRSIDCEVSYYNLNKEFTLDDDLLNSLNSNIDIMFICNPNNPTGILTSKEYIKKVLNISILNNITVVIDESFLDFVEDKNKYSVIELVNEYKNLIVVKSLTKVFAFPGIRIGYSLTSNNDYIEKINKVSVPWSINIVATLGAISAMKDKDYISKTIKYVKEEKDFLYKEIVKFEDLTVYRGSVNFILFKVNKDIDLKNELLKYGILIRSCSNYNGLDCNYYRVAVRRREENIKLIDSLNKVL
ncbi:MAG: threonine-phosphate decarboxylase CobD [Clostridium sp.]|uniref:threonine-phosphate decarboxylase CobD n=1 Tax=Clostridium sp. TaxID=1506 RepID=UPI002FC78A12